LPHQFHELAVIGRRLTEPLTGVGRYIECLLRHWKSQDIPFESIRLYVPGEPQLPADVLGGRVTVEVIAQKVSPLYWENFQLPVRLRSADVIFAPYTLPWFSASRGVVSNLGIYESRPADFSLLSRLRTTPFFRRSVRSAIRTIANSESTRSDLIHHYGAHREQIDVVQLGADERLTPGPPEAMGHLPAEIRAKYRLPDLPYFLLVGKLSRRRNIPLLIKAFAQSSRRLPQPHQLVLIGPDYLGLNPLGLAEQAGIADNVSHTPFAPMDDLAHLYRGATAFVLPTEHEGFSLTVPEAMASGTPAIVFDHAALDGPLRDAAWIVNPTADALTTAMIQIATDEPLRAKLRERSIACAPHYRWETTAQKTMDILAAAATTLRNGCK
jgi:glycosyltransferase involved in cell wall biosynthesis